MRQAFPAAGLAGDEQRPQPDLEADRLDEHPRPAVGQRLFVDRLQPAAKVAVGQHDRQPAFLLHADAQRPQQFPERPRVHVADDAHRDGRFRQPPRRRRRVDALNRPQRRLAGRHGVLTLGEETLLFQPAHGVIDLGGGSLSAELIAQVLRRPAVEAGGDEFVEPPLQDRLALLGQQEDALAGHDFHAQMRFEPGTTYHGNNPSFSRRGRAVGRRAGR